MPLLTDVMIRQARVPEAGRVELWDSKVRGLLLRVTPNGARSWSVFYRFRGEKRLFTLGAYRPEETADRGPHARRGPAQGPRHPAAPWTTAATRTGRSAPPAPRPSARARRSPTSRSDGSPRAARRRASGRGSRGARRRRPSSGAWCARSWCPRSATSLRRPSRRRTSGPSTTGSKSARRPWPSTRWPFSGCCSRGPPRRTTSTRCPCSRGAGRRAGGARESSSPRSCAPCGPRSTAASMPRSNPRPQSLLRQPRKRCQRKGPRESS